MGTCFNIYCDESCHLPTDEHNAMVLGAVVVPLDRKDEVSKRLCEIKEIHDLPSNAELKWGKLSPKFEPLYRNIIDYFFDDDDLSFRAVIARKRGLTHEAYGQTPDDWYYKMYYQLLTNLIVPGNQYQVYLDIKDTRGGPKVKKLHEVLCNGIYDFNEESLRRIQTVRSHEVQLVQLADVLIGAVSYASRGLETSSAKLGIVDRIRDRSGKDLTRSTLQREPKFNLFHWEPSFYSPR